MGRPKKKPVQATRPKQADPCPTGECGPGKARASYFPSDLRLWDVREGGSKTPSEDALNALGGVSQSAAWLMLEDLVEFERDGFLTAALGATSTEAAAAYAFRAQGVEVVLRRLRALRASNIKEDHGQARLPF